jgi:magnesium and cobalt exporter, CNNM family
LDTSEVAQLLALLILIILSAFFSSAETAFSSVNKLRIRNLAEDGNEKAIKINKLLEHPSGMLSAILIANIIVTISAAAIAANFSINRFDNVFVVIAAVAIITVLILIFGEITPKFIANTYPEELSMSYIGFVYVFTKIMSPISFLFNRIAQGLLLLFRINLSKNTSTITEDDLLTIVDASHEEGVIESEERKMITNVVDFGDSVTKDVMVPRADMIFGEVSMSYNELAEIFSTYKYTRLPIYSGSRDNVVGIINLKDMFFYNGDKDNFSIKDVMREPYFTYEYKRTSELFNNMREESNAIAIVLDEYGETAGLITLEDLIEEIVGEIRDEYDEDEEDDIQIISDNEYLVDGNTNLDEINEALEIDLESEEYESIAGYIIYFLDRIPDVGETIIEKNIKLTVDSIDKNRIDKVRIEILPTQEDDERDMDLIKDVKSGNTDID